MKFSLSNPVLRSVLALLALAPLAGAQTTYYVDDDGPHDDYPGFSDPLNNTWSDPDEDGSMEHPFDDLWKAVAVAQNGDEVVVLPSNVVSAYYLSQTLDMQGKAITLRSQGGPAVTALDGTSIPGSPGILMVSGETPSTVVEGFTLRNFDHGSSSGDDGGAMEVRNGSPTIRGCRFEDNHAYVGGGLYLRAASSLVEDCVFLGNSAVHQGGGAYNFVDSEPVYSRCTFEGNDASFGGGYMCWSSAGRTVRFEDCLFLGNTSDAGYGGGLAKVDNGAVEVLRTRFVGNTATTHGGGIFMNGGGVVRASLFNANTSLANQGGGLAVSTSNSHTVTGSTFHGNAGGGVYEFSGVVYLNVYNSIVWGNTPYELTGNVGVNHCDVLGGYAGPNIDADPLFQDADGPDNVPGTLDDDFSLFHLSPCIDAGNTPILPAGYPADLAGNPRAVDVPQRSDTGVAAVGLTTDMGAHEFQVARIGRVSRQ